MIAGIILFNPDILRLQENLESIINQVNQVVLIDNKSENINQIQDLIGRYKKCTLIKNEKNFGVSKALNQIIDFATKNQIEWCITLDQDSICMDDLINNYKKYLSLPKVAMLTCRIEDRNFTYENNEEIQKDFYEVNACITSGSLINVKYCNYIGGFDENMFIDAVDTDMCFSLREAGYKIYKINYVGILHEVGINTKKINFINKDIVVFNHSPFRCYYTVRNNIYMARKHKQYMDTIKIYKSAYHRIIIRLLFENNKLSKFKAGVKGLVDGHKMNINYRCTSTEVLK